MVHNGAAPGSKFACLCISEQVAVLVGEEKPRRYGVYPDVGRVVLAEVHRQPLGEVAHGSLGCSIAHHFGHGSVGRHGRDVQDYAFLLLGKHSAEHLAGKEGSHEVEPNNVIQFIHGQIEEGQIRAGGGRLPVTARAVDQNVHRAEAF